MRQARMRYLLIGLAAVAMLALAQWLRRLSPDALGRADQMASVLNLSVAVIGVAVAWRVARPAQTEDRQDAVHAHLVRRTTALLEAEATIRDLHPPYLQPTRWSDGARSGSIGDLAGYVGELEVPQVVVLGAPGSGKSAMALRLALDLLRDESGRVPVMLSVTSWDPRWALDDWITETLLQVHPELAGGHIGRAPVAAFAGRVLPILDGFDEVPPAARVSVLGRLRTELAAGRPLVLVSAEEPFREAVRVSGRTLARATEVTVQPLAAREAVHYLPLGTHRGEERWRAVIAHIEERPRGRLAALFSSPLAVYLARVAYRDPGTDPGELIAMTNREARAALLGAFLPAVYGERPSRYDAARATRWLRYLARRMIARDRATLHWWALPDLSTAAVVPLRVGVFLVVAVFAAGRYGPLLGVAAATVVSQAVGSLVSSPRPARIVGRPGPLAAGMAGGAALGALMALAVMPGFRADVMILLILGMGLTGAFITGLAFGDAPDDDHVDLGGAIRHHRTVLLVGLVIAAVAGLRSGVQWWSWWMGVQQFARYAAVLLAVLGFSRAGVPWLRFAWVRLVLALAGRTPFRLLRFLDDAHARGVLRRSGAGFEFRHSTVLAYLGTPAPDPGRDGQQRR